MHKRNPMLKDMVKRNNGPDVNKENVIQSGYTVLDRGMSDKGDRPPKVGAEPFYLV